MRGGATIVYRLGYSEDEQRYAFTPVRDLRGGGVTRQLLAECATTGRIDLAAFQLRRAFRIAPAALVHLSVLVLLGAAGVVDIPGRDVAASLLYRRYYVGDGWFTGHS